MTIGKTIIALAAIASAQVSAQNLTFGANNFYRSNLVAVQPVSFPTIFGNKIAGNLHVPKNLTQTAGGAPAIIVGHPMGAVKEQSANLYATKLAEEGFVTVSVDLAFWGGSEGQPRNGVLPDMYSETFSAAVDYLGQQGFVDRERIGALGICGSGSFVISAAKVDSRIKAVATSSMYDMGAVFRNGLNKSFSVEQRKALVADTSRQRTAEVAGAPVQYTGGTVNELAADTPPVQLEFYDFYRTSRGEVTPVGSSRNLTTHPTLSTHIKFLNFYPFNDIDTISPRPLLFVSGDQAHSREFSEDAFKNAAEPKELYWVPGAGHVDLYDRVDLIPFAKFADFFKNGLAPQA